MRNLILTLIIWTICFTAITIGVSLTYKWYRHIGSDIYIHFKDVSGLVPNQSKIMYRGVEIGNINEIDLDPKDGFPRIKARVSKQSLALLGKDSQFWVVRPELGIGQINNLSTISTGDYVAMYPVPGKFTSEFIGLDEEPSEHRFNSGLRLVLKTPSAAGIDIGSGVLYNDLQIGEVGELGLSSDGKHVMITIYIEKPYAYVIRKNSYFGNISGFHANIHIFGGSKITMNSLRTLVKGGIKVVTPNLKGTPAKNDDVFRMLTRDELMELEDKDSC